VCNFDAIALGGVAPLHLGWRASFKGLAAEASWTAGETCFDTFGGFVFAREYNIERKWREARLIRTAHVSTNMVLSFIAQHVLGMPRSY